MKKNKKVINFISSFITSLLLFIVFVLLTILIIIYARTNKNTLEIADFMGVKPVICVSNSMKDVFQVGDITLSKKVSQDEINVGDIITFREGETIITHRVDKIVFENNSKKYVTKGDSNNTVDEKLVEYSNIEGKYFFKIPKLGDLVLTLQKPQVLVLVAIIPLVIVFTVFKIIIYRKEVKEYRKAKLLHHIADKK